jgi:hypothetical protein
MDLITHDYKAPNAPLELCSNCFDSPLKSHPESVVDDSAFGSRWVDVFVIFRPETVIG